MSSAPPRRSISAVVRTDTLAVGSSAPPTARRSLSGRNGSHSTARTARHSLHDGRASSSAALLRRQSLHHKAAVSGSETAADLTAYYAFSRRRSSVVSDDQPGLSGFLEYRKLDGSWRPFLFQTIGYQLVVFRVHVTHQVQVMTTDIRDASAIELLHEGDNGNTRLFQLGINDTVITLRAVSHNVAMYWIEGLRELRDGRLPRILSDRATMESEDAIFQQIDYLSQQREWRPPPSTASASFCGLCFPCLGRLWGDRDHGDAPAGAAAFSTTYSPRPIVR